MKMTFLLSVLLFTASSEAVLAEPANASHPANEPTLKFSHPLDSDTVAFPGEKVPNSRFAAYLAMSLIIRHIDTPLTDSPPLPDKAFVEMPGILNKGDPFWEVRFFSAKAPTELVSRVVVNAHSGLALATCFHTCK